MDVDECLRSPCRNGGLCINIPASYTCACLFGEWFADHRFLSKKKQRIDGVKVLFIKLKSYKDLASIFESIINYKIFFRVIDYILIIEYTLIIIIHYIFS